MSTKWSKLLCKSQVSSYLLKEVARALDRNQPNSVVEDLSIKVESKTDLTKLRKTIRELKVLVPEDLYSYLEEEIDGISEDFKWGSTKQGKYVKEVNDWLQPCYSEFRLFAKYENTYIGGHSEKMVAFVTGKVDSKEIYNDLMNYVISKNPPYKVLVKVTIANEEQRAWPG